jgi:sulfite reductase alpha subunit-like flavoprotein
LSGAQLVPLKSLWVKDLRKLNVPGATDPEDTWKVTTAQGQGWIDRYSGQMVAWQDATLAQRVVDLAVVLHTGESAWLWAVVLGLAGASVFLFWLSGFFIWWQTRSQTPQIKGNVPMAQADVLIFVASEGGSTWGFAQTLQDALGPFGHRVHTSALENFQTTVATQQVFVLAATYGEGQAPAHASGSLELISKLKTKELEKFVVEEEPEKKATEAEEIDNAKKLSDEEKSNFEEAFDERKQLKSFNVSSLQKHLEKAYLEVSDNTETLKEIKKQEIIANTLATNNGK